MHGISGVLALTSSVVNFAALLYVVRKLSPHSVLVNGEVNFKEMATRLVEIQAEQKAIKQQMREDSDAIRKRLEYLEERERKRP